MNDWHGLAKETMREGKAWEPIAGSNDEGTYIDGKDMHELQ